MIRQITTGKPPGAVAEDLKDRIWQAIEAEAGERGINVAVLLGTLELVKAEVLEQALDD